MARRVSPTILIGAVALLVGAAAAAAIGWRASRSTIEAGVWWDDASFALMEGDAVKIGGPLTPEELTRIRQICREEVARAYEGLRIRVTNRRDAFWRVVIVATPIKIQRNNRTTYPFSAAGESHTFGPLGGWGSVSFMMLAHNAIEYAPPDASRRTVVDGIGRGIGRAVVHELAHQMLGTDNLRHIDNHTDEHSYEYWNADRRAQYYGDIRWTTARPVLEAKFGQ